MEATSSASSTSAASVEGLSVVGGNVDYLNLGMFSSGSQQQHSSDVLVGSGFGSSLVGNGFGSNDVASAVGGITTSSSTATSSTAATTNTGTSFVLSDFPTLVTGGGGGGGVSSNNSSTSNGIAAALRQQQLLVQHQQQQQQQQQQQAQQQMLQSGSSKNSAMYRLAMTGTNGNFNMATEDFPALSSSGGGPAPSSTSSNNSNNNNNTVGVTSSGPNTSISSVTTSLLAAAVSSAPSISRTPSNGGASGLYGEVESGNAHLDGGVGAGFLSGNGLTGLGGLRGLQQLGSAPNQQQTTSMSRAPSSTTSGGLPSSGGVSGAIGSNPNSSSSAVTAASSASSSGLTGSGAVAGSALQGDYGLLGLLGVIRMTDADRNALALGSDLTLLGLNLGSADHIYSTFSSPWSSTESSQPTKDPHYQLPSCYYMQPPALKTGHLSKFQLETLFYIFYAMPKDVLQAYAAQELYSREWRYHGELKLWFKRASPADGLVVGNASSTGSPHTQQYLYFDINSWERRLFNGNMNQNITNGFLPDEDVRVKFPNS